MGGNGDGKQDRDGGRNSWMSGCLNETEINNTEWMTKIKKPQRDRNKEGCCEEREGGMNESKKRREIRGEGTGRKADSREEKPDSGTDRQMEVNLKRLTNERKMRRSTISPLLHHSSSSSHPSLHFVVLRLMLFQHLGGFSLPSSSLMLLCCCSATTSQERKEKTK